MSLLGRLAAGWHPERAATIALAHILSLLKQVWVGNGRSSRPPQPKSPRVCGLHCAT